MDTIIQSSSEYITASYNIDWAKWIGVLISACTLYLAYKIYKTFDVHKRFAEKQLSVVFDLVQQMEQCDFLLSYFDETNTERAIYLPLNKIHEDFNPKQIIFDDVVINKPSKFQSKRPEFNKPLLIHRTVFQLPFLHHYYNPFLPKSIAVKMKKLSKLNSTCVPVAESEIDSRYFMITISSNPTSRILLMNDWMHSDDYPYATYHLFSYYIIQLRKSITKWLKKYGAKDLNIDT